MTATWAEKVATAKAAGKPWAVNRSAPRGTICPKCDQIHERCLGHVRNGPRTGQPCNRHPIPGGEVCGGRGGHGGGAPQVRAAASRRVAHARALGQVGRLLDECGIDIAGRTHVDALEDALDRAGRMVVALGLLVDELDVETVWRWKEVQGPQGAKDHVVRLVDEHGDETTPGLYGPDHQGEMRPHVLVVEYGAWLDRYARVAKIAADLGIEERRATIDEARAEVVVGAVLLGLQDAGTDTPEVKAAIANRLRALPS